MVLQFFICFIQFLLVVVFVGIQLALEVVDGRLLVAELLGFGGELPLQTRDSFPVLTLQLHFLLSMLVKVTLQFLEAEFQLGFFGFVRLTHFRRLDLRVAILELQLLFVLLFHLVKEAVNFLLILARKHLEFQIVLAVYLLDLLIEYILVIANLDHVLFN